jgi:hypothetical protein
MPPGLSRRNEAKMDSHQEEMKAIMKTSQEMRGQDEGLLTSDRGLSRKDGGHNKGRPGTNESQN